MKNVDGLTKIMVNLTAQSMVELKADVRGENSIFNHDPRFIVARVRVSSMRECANTANANKNNVCCIFRPDSWELSKINVKCSSEFTMDLNNICRMCSSTKDGLKSIFKDYVKDNLVQIIVNILQLSISSDDGLPSNICETCANILMKMQENVQQFRENDLSLRQIIFQSGETDFNFRDFVSEANPHITYTLQNKSELPIQYESVPIVKQKLSGNGIEVEEKTMMDDGEHKETTTDRSDNSTCGSDSDNAPLQLKRRVLKKPNQRIAKSKQIKCFYRQQQMKTTHDLPKLNDHKCYICGSGESLGSAKALLEHLTIHLNMMPHNCNECVMETVVLKNVRSLNVHKKMHAQPIKCEYCDRRYSDYNSRNWHIKTYHLGESAPCPSTCEQCGKVCKSIAALSSHMRDHKLDVKCDHCGKVFHRMSKFREHVTRVHDKAEKYDCNLCKNVLHSLDSYNSHLKMHNEDKTYICDLCPMKFYTAGNLGLHKKVHAKNANYKPHKDWTSHYTIVQDFDRGKIYLCNQCGKHKGAVGRIISHVKSHFKDIQCDQCNMKFTSMHKLKIHYVVHTRERNYQCAQCGKDFMYRTHLNYHIKKKHGQERADNEGRETEALSETLERKTTVERDAT